jgi:hypothetical protein
MEKKDEGEVLLCSSSVLPVSNESILAYVTQRGSLYLHDLRASEDVHSDQEVLGCQRGMPTCMAKGQDPYQLYFGTLGGYVMVYDIRYNVLAAKFKHFNRAPIFSLATFNPNRSLTLSINKADPQSPLVLVSAGGSNYELSLVNLETCTVEVLLSVDDRKNKESVLSGIPTVPSYLRESLFQVADYDYG